MKNIATFFFGIGLLLISLPALSGPPADAGVKRTDIVAEDDWAITNPISLGTITCPGGELDYDLVGLPFCANSNTGRLHYRDSVFWACVTVIDSSDPTDSSASSMTGIAYYEIWGNWDAESTGPVGGTWKIVPSEVISKVIGEDYTCDRLGPFPEDLVANASDYWFGTWIGKRSYQEFGDMGFWVGEFRIVGKGYGETLEGLHFTGEERVPTYTPFPVPYEFLPPDSGLNDVAEGVLTGTITE